MVITNCLQKITHLLFFNAIGECTNNVTLRKRKQKKNQNFCDLDYKFSFENKKYSKLAALILCTSILIQNTEAIEENMAVPPVILPTTAKHTATIIFFHGLGDSGHGWSGAMGTVKQAYMKIICPTANTIPVTLNNGFKMPSWFDIKGLDITSAEDADGIKKATQYVHSLIDKEISSGIPSERIVLGGFSQGGALAIHSGLHYPKKLGGIIALSCWLPLHKQFSSANVTANLDIPILQCHGDCDPIVSYSFGQLTASVLRKISSRTEFRTYVGVMHSSTEEEIQDIKTFLLACIPDV